jgi:tetratricopeptide (TPR) repeat protein
MSLAPGTRLGPYQISALIGAGGMGEDYHARDTRLGRDVAIKVIPAELARDADRIRRFEQETRAAGALNHPNVSAIYDIGTHEGLPYVVMELLEGESLQQRLTSGPIPLRKALDYATQLAHGLAAAHEKGIVHRDLKPGNVFVTKDGRVKVLDFGLAKLTRPDVLAPSGEATASVAATQLGALMGTPAYMSPEQAEGRHVDARSDVFSFGALLYEMLTGRRPFEGASELSLLSSILRDTPPRVRSLRPDADPGLEILVERCLEKDPAARPATARELVPELEALSARDSVRSVGRLLRRPAWAAGLVLVLAVLGGLAFWAWRAGTQERWARRVAMPEIQRLIDADEIVAAFRLARKARGPLADDPEFQKLWQAVTVTPAEIATEPEGTEVLVKPYEEPDGKWERLGVSPIKGAFLPFTPHRVRITKPGFAPVEAVIIPSALHDTARVWLDTLLPLAANRPASRGRTLAWLAAGMVSSATGEWERSLKEWRNGFEDAKVTGDARAAAEGVMGMGYCNLSLGRIDEARAALDDAIARGESGVSPFVQGIAMSLKGMLLFTTGDADAGMALVERARQILVSMGDHELRGVAISMLAQMTFAKGDPSRALALYYESLASLEAVGDHPEIARVYSEMGWTALATSDARAAQNAFVRAVQENELVGSPPGTAVALMGLAAVEVAESRPERAIEIAAVAHGLSRRAGVVIAHPMAPGLAERIEALKASIPKVALEGLEAKASTLSPAGIVAMVAEQ